MPPRPFAAAVKPNLAFYEALGSDGLAALERIRASIPADIPVVIDAKRADIGSTAARHAVALFDRLGADAVTVNPYPGGDAIAPLFERAGPLRLRALPHVEPGRADVPEPDRRRGPGDAAPRPNRSTCASRDSPRRGVRAGRSGWSSAPRRPRSCAPSGPPHPDSAFLVPGIGAQGGEIGPVLADGPATAAPAGSGDRRRTARQRLAGHQRRGPRRAADGGPRDPGERIAAAARDWASKLPVLP